MLHVWMNRSKSLFFRILAFKKELKSLESRTQKNYDGQFICFFIVHSCIVILSLVFLCSFGNSTLCFHKWLGFCKPWKVLVVNVLKNLSAPPRGCVNFGHRSVAPSRSTESPKLTILEIFSFLIKKFTND